jgi:HEAT repeat protein
MQALERCVSDPDRDVRITAARSLASRSHRPSAARLQPIIGSKEIRAADVTEKMAMFESYGAVSGDGGVPQLDTILNGKGFFGGREEPEIRAAAAAGLGRIGTEKAREALQRAAADKEPLVRNSVARALRGGTT